MPDWDDWAERQRDGRTSEAARPSRAAERRSVARTLVAMLVAAAAGWCGFMLYERYATGAKRPDARLEELLARGAERLVAGDVNGAEEQLHKASGVAENDARVAEGLALAAVVRAELAWWPIVARPSEGDIRAAASEMERVVARVEGALTAARRHVTDAAGRARLELLAQRLAAMRAVALARRGDLDGARRAIAGLPPGHALGAVLLREIGTAATTAASVAPATSASTSVSAVASASAPASAPRPAAPAREHYELDDEPAAPAPQPGELELPARK
jgi:hypothetical protein